MLPDHLASDLSCLLTEVAYLRDRLVTEEGRVEPWILNEVEAIHDRVEEITTNLENA